MLVGLVGGCIAGAYWLVLERRLRVASPITGGWVVPPMGGAGLLAGLIIHRLGDLGKMSLLVDNIRFRTGRLDPKGNLIMVLSSLFGPPLGGGLFALEILHHRHLSECFQALIPAFVSSCASFVVFC